MVIRGTLLLLSLAAPAAFAGGGSVGYAQATGYFKQASRPTLYQPLNLLDGRAPTAWCSPTNDPLNDLLTFGFSAPVRLEALRVTTGNNFDENIWATFARAKKLVLKSGKQSQVLELQDVRSVQTLELKQPMTGARFSIEVLDQYPAEDPEQPVCLTDVVFVAEGKPLNGPWLTTKLKYDRAQAGLMGTWYAGFPGSPDRFLSFNFGGTFRYSFEPLDEKRATPGMLEGRYDVSGTRLMLELNGRKVTLKMNKDSGKEPTLAFEGEVPEELKGAWRSAP